MTKRAVTEAKPFDADEEAKLRELSASWPESFDVRRLFATLDRERRERDQLGHAPIARTAPRPPLDPGQVWRDGWPCRSTGATLCQFCLGTAKVPPCKACHGMGWHAP